MPFRALRLVLAYSVDDVRSFPKERSQAYEILIVPDRSRWLYVPSSRADDDGENWLLPTWNTAAFAGRWGRWQIVADSGEGGGESSPLTTKGDLHTYDTADARLPVGADNEVLIADSGEPTGLRWGSAPGGSYSPPIPESDVAGLVSDLTDLASDIASEASARASADSAEAVTRAADDASEAAARAAADTSEAAARAAADTAETAAREAADNRLEAMARSLAVASNPADSSNIIANQVFGG